MKKILLPTDFSENAYNAVEYAVNLFQDQKCTFYLLNTYTLVVFDNEYVLYNTSVPSINEFHLKESQNNLQKTILKIRKNHPNERHFFKRISSINGLTEEIKNQVKDKGIDMVVMGTKGATGAKQFLFGSNTVHAIRGAGCPLLVVPSEFYFEKPQKVLFPSDLEIDFTQGEFGIMKEIIQMHSAEIHILHVNKEDLTVEQKEVKKNIINELGKSKIIFQQDRISEVAEAIYDYQEKNNMDMLIMVNNKHSFFENLLFLPLVNKIGFHTKIPFLVIPRKNILKNRSSKKKNNIYSNGGSNETLKNI